MNIPIYRAKKLDTNEYEIGFLLNNMIVTAYEQEIKRDGIYWKSITATKIDPTTLAIHFSDMLDSQGNKIFASLREDGKGGDIVNCYLGKNQNIPTREKQTVKYYKPYYMGLKSYDIDAYSKLEVIGIQE